MPHQQKTGERKGIDDREIPLPRAHAASRPQLASHVYAGVGVPAASLSATNAKGWLSFKGFPWPHECVTTRREDRSKRTV